MIIILFGWLIKMEAIPYKVNDVHTAILKHDNYKTLDLCTKMQFEECVKNKNADNNKYCRKLWCHLYQGKELPLG